MVTYFSSLKIGTKRINRCMFLIFLCICNLSFHTIAFSKEKSALPRIQVDSLNYIGAFRLPNKFYWASSFAYSEGVFDVVNETNTFFSVGHSQQQAIGEFSIPQLSKSSDIASLPMAKMIQPFVRVLHKASHGNNHNINRITGIEVLEGQMLVNATEYYDANANAADTTLVIRDINNLKKTKVDGYFQLKGGAHAAGWITPIPKEWRNDLGSEYITGFASNLPINGRSSIGPTAFTFFPFSLLDPTVTNGFIPTNALMDFSLKTPLHPDRYNETGNNKIWTEISTAQTGFIVPGTSTYMVVGNSGGHFGGIGYKIKQDNGKECSGPCSKKVKDNYNYIWLWDVNEFVKVKNAEKKPYELKPYYHGIFDINRKGWRIAGADFQASKGWLYVMYDGVDKSQGQYEPVPLMTVYSISK